MKAFKGGLQGPRCPKCGRRRGGQKRRALGTPILTPSTCDYCGAPRTQQPPGQMLDFTVETPEERGAGNLAPGPRPVTPPTSRPRDQGFMSMTTKRTSDE